MIPFGENGRGRVYRREMSWRVESVDTALRLAIVRRRSITTRYNAAEESEGRLFRLL